MKKAALITNISFSLIMLIMGFIYLFKSEFMPYHAIAVGAEWSQVPQGFQVLILALMKATSGGFLACALSIIYLELKFIELKQAWISNVILLIGILVPILTLYATLYVRFNSTAKPPSLFLGMGMATIIIGFILNRKYLNSKN